MGVKVVNDKEVFYTEAATTKTYEKIKNWQGVVSQFDISNIGAAPLTIEINDDKVTRTLLSLNSKGWTYKNEIVKVVVTATDSFELLLRG